MCKRLQEDKTTKYEDKSKENQTYVIQFYQQILVHDKTEFKWRKCGSKSQNSMEQSHQMTSLGIATLHML